MRFLPRRRLAGPAFLLAAALALGTAAILAVTLAATPVAAQGFGWFGNLFGGFPRPAPGAPSYPGYAPEGYAPRQSGDPSYARPRRRAVRRPVEQAPRETAKAPPKNASMFVVVLGDSLGQMLGQGLDEALADRPDVAIAQKARSATGLVADSYYDWPKAIGELLGTRKAGDKAGDAKGGEGKGAEGKAAEAGSAEAAKEATKEAAKPAGEAKPGDRAAKPASAKPARERIDVAVMMIGTNDHQPLTVDGRVLQPGTVEWTAAYTRRVMAIDEAFRARNIPLVWVGVPITKDDAYADAMAGLNDVYREAAAKTGATYVDTWEAFSDENGNFAAYGPDVNGQTVRLRAADGIHFTGAGARKLAHFVEVHVRRALEGKTPTPQLPVESADGKDVPDRRIVAARPDVGPIRNLNEAPTTADGVLTTLAVPSPDRADTKGDAKGDSKLDPKADARPEASRSAVAAGDAVPAGRADNARWSGDPRAEP